MSVIPLKNSQYGFPSPLSNYPPFPIISLRNPTGTDYAALGSIWVNKLLNNAYILTSIVSNVANWNLIEAAGGVGAFTSLLVTPGPVLFTGTTNINTIGAAVTNLGTGGTGVVNIGNTTGGTVLTGAFTVNSAGAALLLGTDAVSHATTIGSLTGASPLLLQAGASGIVVANSVPYFQFQGPFRLMSGAGAPAAGLATETGDIYINLTAATATTRMYIATAPGAWTNITCAA